MVCIYCGNKTQVINSRPQKRLMQVWRRRKCTNCGAIFTTNELVDLTGSLVVRLPEGGMQPFSRDKLYVSVLRACGHRTHPIEDASALTATIIMKLRRKALAAALSPAEIVSAAHETLKRFDTAAGVQYAAYHQTKN